MMVRARCCVFIILGGFISMMSIFTYTMFSYYQSLDYGYLVYAALRIAGLSVALSVLGILVPIKRASLSFALGVVGGPIVGALYIRLFVL